MTSGIERRRTIRIQRSQLLKCKLDALDKPAIKILEDHDEYCRNFRLVYNEYLDAGYTASHPSKMLYNTWSLLPSTAIFAFKSFHNIISTISLIQDTNLFGLPIDAVFKDKIDDLRGQGRRVAEIGALASTRMRRWSNVIMLLFRALFYYSSMAKINDVVIMVNPKHVRFYTQMLLFEPFGEPKEYDKVGAPAAPLRVNLDTYADRLAEVYSGNDFETDLHTYFTNFSDPMLASVGEAVKGLRKTLDPYSAFFFFKSRPEILTYINQEQRDFLVNHYHQDIFPLESLEDDAESMRRIVRPVLEQLHLENKDDYTDTAFSRNLGLIKYSDQRKLLETRVAIPGLGGVGGSHLTTLARTGIGAFNIADFDIFSPVNVNRQHGSDMTSFNRSKLSIMRDRALGINPFLDIRCYPEGVTLENMDEFLEGVHILVDSLDFFAQDIRRLLFNRALAQGIPVITAAPAGYSCSMLCFMPGGMNYDEYFGVTDETDDMERLIRFSLGLAPRPAHMSYMNRHFVNLYDKRVPSLDIGCQISAGMAATEVVRIRTEGKPMAAVPSSVQFDAKRGVLRKCRLRNGVNTPWQRTKLALARRFLLPPPQMNRIASEKPAPIPQLKPVSLQGFQYITRAAMQAPSGDNVQPWSFAFGGNTIRLFINRKIDRSFFNVKQTASLLACGAALQNIEYAAGSLGLESRSELFPEGEGTDLIAKVHLTPTGQPFEELMERALWRRHTNRRMYSTTPITPAVWERLGALAAGQDDSFILLHSSGRESLSLLSKAVYLADRVRVERRDLHEYLMKIIKFNPVPRDINEAACPEYFKTGMPLKNLEAGLAGNIFLRMVRPWPVMNAVNAIGLGRAMPLYAKLSVLRSGGVGLICANTWTEGALVNAGRAMQRVWCALEQFGFAAQPMAALPLFTLRQRMDEGESFSPEHQKLLKQAWELAESVLGVPPDYAPIFMFRTGFASPVSQRTYRQNIEDVMRRI